MNYIVKPLTTISLLTAILLVVGCFHLPIGYYTFLRIIVFIASFVLIVMNRDKGLSFVVIVTAFLGILFNPIIPVYLHNKTAWVVIDTLAAAWFLYLSIFLLKVKY